jgi:DNA invertase Pin-like site-specific DNA recombinase
MYEAAYNNDTGQDLTAFMSEIENRYQTITRKPIRTARNPRRAGRKPLYGKDKANEIKAVYGACKSVTRTAEKCGVSTTTVYKAIK